VTGFLEGITIDIRSLITASQSLAARQRDLFAIDLRVPINSGMSVRVSSDHRGDSLISVLVLQPALRLSASLRQVPSGGIDGRRFAGRGVALDGFSHFPRVRLWTLRWGPLLVACR
jgi:hypothetical protein